MGGVDDGEHSNAEGGLAALRQARRRRRTRCMAGEARSWRGRAKGASAGVGVVVYVSEAGEEAGGAVGSCELARRKLI